jgi:regulator of sirC expression with transglutaminase-like and TPR domain
MNRPPVEGTPFKEMPGVDVPAPANAAEALAHLRALAVAPDERFPLGSIALLLGAHGRLQAGFPVSLPPYLRHLQELGAAIRATGGAAAAAGERAEALYAVLFRRFQYSGDAEDYDNPANANLLAVIDRRRGLPVSLAILLILTARACGWPAYGIPYPGHVLVGLEGRDGAAIIDPFTGRLQTPTDLCRLAERFRREPEPRLEDLQPASDRVLLLRLQNNLRSRFSVERQPSALLAALDSMLALEPSQPRLWFEAAQIHADAGGVRGAIEAYRQALQAGLAGPERLAAEQALVLLGRRLN